MRNVEKNQTIRLYSSIYHIFSPPLKVCMLRKVRCRIQLPTQTDELVPSPLSIVSSKRQPLICSLNESQNCAETTPDEYTSSIVRCKQYSSLIAIDIGNDESSQTDKIKFRKKIYLHRHRQSLIRLTSSDSSLAISSHDCSHYRNQVYRCLTASTSTIHKGKSDSQLFIHQHRNSISISKQQPPSDYSTLNTNSRTYESPILTDTTINSPSSNSEISTSLNKKTDKTWRLKIHDELNKDGSRHFVVHKGSEESVRKRRQNKRAKRSEEKKRKVGDKVSKANQRWQKYSNIDYELVFFISRYYDQLPLCSNCRNYFTTHQTQFLSEDPRASLDYAADAALRSSNNKSITVKQAAKARLIQDYDKQTDIIFHLCDTCLTECERIHTELKQINSAQKSTNEITSPNIDTMTAIKSELQQQQPIVSPSLSPPTSPPSPLNIKSEQPQQTVITNLDQLYIDNIIQYHQIKLQQLYQQSQNIIAAQQYQQNYPLAIDQQRLHHDLQLCTGQMQYHCLELLHLQYPGYDLSFPYIPSYDPKYLFYRHQEMENENMNTESSTCNSKHDSDNQRDTSSEDDNDTRIGNNKYSSTDSSENQQSMDDRLTVKTCHGLIEYYNAPIDDFIRGIQVLKCLSNFNRYSS